jgi:hypothetical protein
MAEPVSTRTVLDRADNKPLIKKLHNREDKRHSNPVHIKILHLFVYLLRALYKQICAITIANDSNAKLNSAIFTSFLN